MNALKKKLNKNGGFTLVEMLIVVAIIAILIAVSIPLVNSALEKSRDATDQANERAAKAEAAIILLTPEDYDDEYDALVWDGVSTKPDGLDYDAEKGKFSEEEITPYGRCTGKGINDYCEDDHTESWVNVIYNAQDEDYEITWSDGTAGGTP